VKISNIYTLATTIVDECNNADTGVGLSIASGNHPLKACRDDFAATDSNIKLKTPPIRAPNSAMSLTRLCLRAEADDVLAILRLLNVEIK
jgi:hypothetical protein